MNRTYAPRQKRAYAASTKQIAFARSLLAAILNDDAAVDAAMERNAHRYATSTAASAWIDQLLAHKRQMNAVRVEDTTERTFVDAGFFLLDGRIYKVVPSRSTGRHYAMTLQAPGEKKGKWDYAKGAMFHLTDAHRLTLEQAREYGKTHGFCIVCGALLTDPKSVEQGIGPICAKKF